MAENTEVGISKNLSDWLEIQALEEHKSPDQVLAEALEAYRRLKEQDERLRALRQQVDTYNANPPMTEEVEVTEKNGVRNIRTITQSRHRSGKKVEVRETVTQEETTSLDEESEVPSLQAISGGKPEESQVESVVSRIIEERRAISLIEEEAFDVVREWLDTCEPEESLLRVNLLRKVCGMVLRELQTEAIEQGLENLPPGSSVAGPASLMQQALRKFSKKNRLIHLADDLEEF